MVSVASPRLLIAGVGPGVGKSLVTIGLVHELRRRGVGVSCCVTGPSLVEAAILRRISGRYVRCLDGHLLSSSQNVGALAQAALGAELILIEGNAGLFDGYTAGSLRGSDAEVAASARVPAVLVADAFEVGASVGAVYKGYATLAKNFPVVGLILNRIQTRDANADEQRPNVRDRAFYESSMAAFGLPKLLGAIPVVGSDNEIPRAGVSERKNFSTLNRSVSYRLGEVMNECLDFPALLQHAGSALPIESGENLGLPFGRRTRIAVSDDSCFNLGFQDNLDLLRYYGAELVPFSPLADTKLPPRIGGLYLTGAYLPEYADILAENAGIRIAIKEFAQNGGAIFSESGGTAFLCDSFQVAADQPTFAGAGVLQGTARFGSGRLAYVEAVTMDDSIFGSSGAITKGVTTGEWRFEEGATIPKTMRCSRLGGRSLQEGYSPTPQSLLTFSLFHLGSNPDTARAIVDAAALVSGRTEMEGQ